MPSGCTCCTVYRPKKPVHAAAVTTPSAIGTANMYSASWPTCGLILCGSPRPVVLGGPDGMVDPANLFPQVTAEISKGVTGVDLWRRMDTTEHEQRHRLIRLLHSRQEPTF